MNRTAMRPAAAVLIASLLLATGCSSSPREVDDPVTKALDNKQSLENRVQSVRDAFARAVTEADRIGVRTELTPQIWSNDAAPEVKVAIVQELLKEKSERLATETREDLRLNLPLQVTRGVVVEVCRAAAERGWKEFVPAIVRTWATPLPGVDDEDRVERAAIVALASDASVTDTVFSVFISPPADSASTKRMKLEERYRLSAWEVLSRLDPSGRTRLELLARRMASQDSGAGTPFVRELYRVHSDFGILPGMSDELLWLQRLLDGKSQTNAAWWADAKSAVAGLTPGQRNGLEIRHLEPIRWAAKHGKTWQGMERDKLAAFVVDRIKDRDVYEATGNRPSGRGRILENVEDVIPMMTWADMIALLVVDESIKVPAVVESLFTYAGYDERDKKTEYGGLLQAVDSDAARPFIATLYAPRPGDRYDDRRFVASQDMIDASDRALAHWHFHVAERSNSAYAGPSLEDLDYAGRQGRTCVVFTSLGGSRMNADYFQRGGIIVDLGVVEKPRP